MGAQIDLENNCNFRRKTDDNSTRTPFPSFSSQSSRSPRRTRPRFLGVFLPPFSARSRLHFLRRLPLGNLGAETIHSAASEQRQCHAVSPFTPLLPIRTGVEENNAVLSWDGVSKMDGTEFCSKVTATSITGGNGDIAWD